MEDPVFAFYATYHNAIEFCLFLLGTLLGAWLLTFLFKRTISRWVRKTQNKLDDRLLPIVAPFVFGGLVLWGFYMALIQLPFVQSHQAVFDSVLRILFIVLLLIVFVRLISTIFTWVSGNGKLKKQQKGLVLAAEKILNVLVYFLGFLFALDAAGISITPLVASLGIGGLAVSLALQPTLSNYFAGLYLAADAFLQVNDYVRMDGQVEGVITDIGSRNTLIRTWDNNLIIVPNSKMANNVVTNFSEPEGAYIFAIDCAVAYDSDLEQVEKVASKVASVIQKKDVENATREYEPKVSFRAFGESNIEFRVFMQSTRYVAYYSLRHQFIKALKKAFDQEGIRIAFPTRSVEFLNGAGKGFKE